MKRKRLDRDRWGFQGFPYAQMRVDIPQFHGMACLIDILSGENCCWHMPKAGRVPVCGKGMYWLQLIPDGQRRVITCKYRPDNRVAVWYVDVIDRMEMDPDGVAVFVDAYLDVIFSPQGDVKVDDRDELDAAYAAGEMDENKYRQIIAESENIMREMCADTKKTEKWCTSVLRYVRAHLDAPDTFIKNAVK